MLKQHKNLIYRILFLFFTIILFKPNTNQIQSKEDPFFIERTENIIYTVKNHLTLPKVQAENLLGSVEVSEEFTPNTSNRHPQWNHNMMNIGQAWADGYTGKGISIAVLDTGFFIQHPDSNIAGGNSVFPDDPWSNDHSGHGTHIAGIISAKRGSQFQGIAPGAEVYGIKIYHENDVDEDGGVSTTVRNVISGIEQAIALEVDIIVISSGLGYHDPELYDVIKKAHDLDIMIFAASGNGQQAVNYPASYSEVIAVTAIDEQLNPALDIIYGQENDFSAPGVQIGGLSIPDSTYSYPYIYMSGSSQAAPHAAGLAAILMEKYKVRGEEIRKIMQQQALSIGDSGLYGHGLLQYVSDDKDKNNVLTPNIPEKEFNNEEEPTNQDPLNPDEVRKPASSREADNSNEDEDLVAFNHTDIISSPALGSIDNEALDLVENRGALEINMADMNSLFLTQHQISQIRHRNISIILTKGFVSWTIPPGNFFPGAATLRFYDGTSTGVEYDRNATFGLHTISIYQEDTRGDAYPSWMRISYDIDQLNAKDIVALIAHRWNREEYEWVETESEIVDGRIILRTRYTTSVGFIDPNLIVEPVAEPEEVIEEDSGFLNTLSGKLVIGFVIFSSLLIAVRYFIHKKKSRK